MKCLKPYLAFFMLMASFGLTACHDEKNMPDIIQTPVPISESIAGKWLLATSNNREWTVYEFKPSQQMTIEWSVNNSKVSGSGSYFTNDEKSSLTGTIINDQGKYIYLDWIVKRVQAYQIDIDIYGGEEGNQFLYSDALYKILGSQEMEYGSKAVPDYRKYTGTDECSGFISMDESVVAVNSSGEVECVGVGSTYLVFNTPTGHACIKVTVSDRIMTFSENMLGTWITEVKGYIWEKDVFGQDGYFYSQWSREGIYPTSDESAQGTYMIDEAAKTITVSATTPYNQKLNAEYKVTRIDKYSFNADIYSGGDKTGTFYYQRLLGSISIEPKESSQPNYLSMTGSSQISGFNSHDDGIATVDKTTGLVTGISKGITYIDVITANGTGVIEVSVGNKQ